MEDIRCRSTWNGFAHVRQPLSLKDPLDECERCRGDDESMRAAIARGPSGRPADGLGVKSEDLPWCAAPPVTEGVRWHSSRTMYHWDGVGEDPNQPVALCPACAEEHHEHWDDMWSNVPGYGG
jgi:hypothetical protein